MIVAEPVTFAAEYEVPKFPSSIWASIGMALSSSRLRNTAIEAVSKLLPIRSLPGAKTIGAMRSDSGLAGPREENVTWLDWQSLLPNTVKQSDRLPPTEIKFFAVAGGATWIGFGLGLLHGTGQSSAAVPLNRSGMTRSHSSGRFDPIKAPLLPTGATTMKSLLLERKVSTSAACC